MNIDHTHMKDPSIPNSVSVIVQQILLLTTLLVSIYMHALELPILPTVVGLSSLMIIALSIWAYRNTITWFERTTLLAILFLSLYAQFFSQKGALAFPIVLSYMFLGFSFGLTLRHSRFNRWLLHGFGYLALLPFIYGFFIMGIDLRRGGEFLGMNRNTIPRLLFMSCSLVFLAQYIQKQRTDIVLAALTVLISFLSRSRAGLLISSGLCILVLLQGYVHIPIRTWLQGHRFLAVLLVLIALVILFFAGMYLFENSRLETQGLDSNGRQEIHMKFLHELTPQRVLLGYRPAILDGIGLHSSYLTLLSMFGVLTSVVVVCFLLLIFRLGKQSLFLFGLLLLFSVYSLVESLSPFAEGDVLLITLILCAQPVNNNNSASNEHRQNIQRLIAL